MEQNIKSMYQVKKEILPSVFYPAFLIFMTILLLPSAISYSNGHGSPFNVAYAHNATIPVGIAPYGIKYNPSNENIYVANVHSSTVSVIS